MFRNCLADFFFRITNKKFMYINKNDILFMHRIIYLLSSVGVGVRNYDFILNDSGVFSSCLEEDIKDIDEKTLCYYKLTPFSYSNIERVKNIFNDARFVEKYGLSEWSYILTTTHYIYKNISSNNILLELNKRNININDDELNDIISIIKYL